MKQQPTVPLFDLSFERQETAEAVERATRTVLETGQYILGPEVVAFEEEVSRFLGCQHAVSCNSGTDALVLGLRSLGVGAGDEVITSPFTFVATAEAIRLVGADPIFVDIDPRTFNLDPNRIAPAITSRTKAVLPVHLYGLPAPMDSITRLAREHGLAVLEDAAQSFGAKLGDRRAGTLGNAGAFSFFPTKNLGACGDGGLLVTDDAEIADAARTLRVHGSRQKNRAELLGYNSRLDAIQAAILRVKLPRVDAWNRARMEAARAYRHALSGLSWLEIPAEEKPGEHVYHLFTVRILGGARDAVARELDAKGIETRVYYPYPLSSLALFAEGLKDPLPEAERAAREVLSLPMSVSLESSSIERIAAALRAIEP